MGTVELVFTLPCVSLRAMKIGRQAPTILLPRRYTPAKQKQFSRPMTGHTPQKLPPFGAISCIIASLCAVSPHNLRYDTIYVTVCQALFQSFLQNFFGIFGKRGENQVCVLKGRILSCGYSLAFRPACRRATFPRGEGEAETSPGRLRFWQPAGGIHLCSHSLYWAAFSYRRR